MGIAIRPCQPREEPVVAALANRVFRPNGGGMRTEYPLMFAPDNREGLRVAVRAATPVALVGVCIRDAIRRTARASRSAAFHPRLGRPPAH
jgi:hypothetical protein